ncbi:MAG: hypothetical protein MMC23_005739 [Stictis urceolatum]|nr:hypothetical protein [Stictis urceolata]
MSPSPDSRADGEDWSEPYVVSSQKSHKQTFIILHGRGDQGENFGARLLMWTVNGPQLSEPTSNLQDVFPHAKFVFPTAKLRKARALNNTKVHQWFDIWKITEQTDREELQFKGLRETTTFIHSLLRKEIAVVGRENVVLWGLSQGCASSLTALMLWKGEQIAACVGMCGWLPLRPRLDSFLQDMKEHADGSQEHVTFEGAEDNLEVPEEGQVKSDHELNTETNGQLDGEVPLPGKQKGGTVASENGATLSPEQETIQHLADTIDMMPITEKPSMLFQQVPILLGHGTKDEKVPLYLGREAVELLQKMGAAADIREYEGLGHWYSSDMLRDTVAFLHEKLGITAKQRDRMCKTCNIL